MSLLYQVRVFNTRDKLKFSVAVSSFDDVISYLDSKMSYARLGWHAHVDLYDEDDMDTLVDRDVFFFHDEHWSN